MSELFNLLFTIISKLNKSVKTETQVLTEEQKTQARANIGAMSADYTPPNQTAQQVGADPAGTAASAVSAHNTNGAAHSDIRARLEELSARLTTFLNCDDTTLDQTMEMVAYMKDNRELIESITTGKVSTDAIVDNLTTADAKKVLSANQGVEIKRLIDAIDIALANKPDLTAAEIETLTGKIQ